MQPHGVMFHHFHGGRHAPSQGSISARELEALIDSYAPGRLLAAREWLERSLRDSLRPGHVCLTFDDNLRCQFDVAAPVLRSRGLTAFWFVSTGMYYDAPPLLELHRAFRERCYAAVGDFYADFEREVDAAPWAAAVRPRVELFDPETFLGEFPFYTPADRRFRYLRDEALSREQYESAMGSLMRRRGCDQGDLAGELWMSPEHLCALHAEGHVIGLHTHTHPTRVAYLDEAAQRREYRDNLMALMELLSEPPLAVSHPCNSYDDRTLAILRGLGLRVGFRANLSQRTHSELEYPREDHMDALRRMRSPRPARA